MKTDFKISFERPNLPVATGMSENLIYKPQNLDLIADKLAELNQTDTEKSSAVNTDRLVSVSDDESVDLENWNEPNQENQPNLTKKLSVDPVGVELMYSNEFDTIEKAQNSQESPKTSTELSESFLDLQGSPIKSNKLMYTPTDNKIIDFRSFSKNKKSG